MFEKPRYSLTERYGHDLLIALVLITALNVLDSVFTMIILDEGGTELNPVVQAAIRTWGDRFWLWKFILVSLNLFLLCLHSHFRFVKAAIFGIGFIYLAVVAYQIFLLNRILIS